MKVLILANNDVGLYKFRKELIEELIHPGSYIVGRKAKPCKIYISLPDGEFVPELKKLGCKYINTPIDRRGVNPIKDLRLLMMYWKMLKKVKPDMVVTYTIKPNIYGGIAARLANVSYAENITGLGTAFERSGFLRAMVVDLYKLALKKAKIIFFENKSNRDELLFFDICDKNKTKILSGAGVNTETFNYQPYPHNDTMAFLFVGRVMKEKGIDELFGAMRRLVSEGKKCTLDIVGPIEDDYKDKLHQYETEGWLQYHGFQADVRPFISVCDCFVLPSYHEGMANTNLECAASGRPLITSNISGCKEAVIEGVSGLLCEPKNTASLYQAMKKMVAMKREQREQMGKAGRKHIEDVFDKRKVVAATVAELMK